MAATSTNIHGKPSGIVAYRVEREEVPDDHWLTIETGGRYGGKGGTAEFKFCLNEWSVDDLNLLLHAVQRALSLTGN